MPGLSDVINQSGLCRPRLISRCWQNGRNIRPCCSNHVRDEMNLLFDWKEITYWRLLPIQGFSAWGFLNKLCMHWIFKRFPLIKQDDRAAKKSVNFTKIVNDLTCKSLSQRPGLFPEFNWWWGSHWSKQTLWESKLSLHWRVTFLQKKKVQTLIYFNQG